LVALRAAVMLTVSGRRCGCDGGLESLGSLELSERPLREERDRDLLNIQRIGEITAPFHLVLCCNLYKVQILERQISKTMQVPNATHGITTFENRVFRR
jgi:hypothetical protein